MIDITKTCVERPGLEATQPTQLDSSLEASILGRPDLAGQIFHSGLTPTQIDLNSLPNFDLRVWWLLFIDKSYGYKDAVEVIKNYYDWFAAEYDADGTEALHISALRHLFQAKIDAVVACEYHKIEAKKQEQKKAIAVNLVMTGMKSLIEGYFIKAFSYQEWSDLALIVYYLFKSDLSSQTIMTKLQSTFPDDQKLLKDVKDLSDLIREYGIGKDIFDSVDQSKVNHFSLFGRFLKLWPKLNTFMLMPNNSASKVVDMIQFLLIPNRQIRIVDKLSLLELIHGLLENGNVAVLDKLNFNLKELDAIKNLVFFQDCSGSTKVEIEGLIYENRSYRIYKFIF